MDEESESTEDLLPETEASMNERNASVANVTENVRSIANTVLQRTLLTNISAGS